MGNGGGKVGQRGYKNGLHTLYISHSLNTSVSVDISSIAEWRGESTARLPICGERFFGVYLVGEIP